MFTDELKPQLDGTRLSQGSQHGGLTPWQGLWLPAPSCFVATSRSQHGRAVLGPAGGSPFIRALVAARHRGGPWETIQKTPSSNLPALKKYFPFCGFAPAQKRGPAHQPGKICSALF